MREIIKPALVLFIVCVLTTAILAVVKTATEPTIAAQAAANQEAARKAALPAAASFVPVPADKLAALKDGKEFSATVTGAWLGHDAAGAYVGAVFTALSRGYDAAGVQLTIGVDAAMAIVDIKVGDNKETPGLGTNVLDAEGPYMGQYRGKAPQAPLNLVKIGASKPEDVQAVAGATITSRAVSRAAQGALELARKIGPAGEVK